MLNKFSADQRGSVIIVFSLIIPVLLATAGAATDYGRLAARRAQLQKVADAAAQSAAKVLASNYGQTQSVREAAAIQAANSYANGAAPTASTVTTPSLATNSVDVQITETLNLMFGGFIGHAGSSVGALAKAKYNLPPACVVALGVNVTTGIQVDGSAAIEAPGCSVWSNTPTATSMMLNNAGKITAGKVCAVGGGSGGTVTPTMEKYCQPAPDPFAGRNLTSGTRACDHTNKVVQASTTLSPGVYCGGLLVKGSVTVTLAPGLYEIRGGPLHLQGNGTVNGNGVSILLGSGAYLDYQGSPNVNIAAMTTGALAGLAIASDPATPAQTSTMLGNSTTFLTAAATGSIYLRNHTLTIGGNSDLVLNASPDLLAVRALVVSGSAKVKSVTKLSTRPELVLTH
jgi:Flp pilus assembly protein TadG